MATTNDVDALTQKRATDVLRDSDRDSVGVVRVLSKNAGSPGEEREYEAGDEALVETGQAEWVLAPVHLPSAGRRLDHDAERGALPREGIEVYPPAEPTSGARRVAARLKGWVDAHSDDSVADKISKGRVDAERSLAQRDDSDAKLQAELGGNAARSGPATAYSDLPSDNLTPEDTSEPTPAKKNPSAKAG